VSRRDLLEKCAAAGPAHPGTPAHGVRDRAVLRRGPKELGPDASV